jgi:hypothetical protein
MLARDILQKMSKHSGKKLTVIDVGCGSGWKLVHYLSDQFRTIGIDTEPAFSFLKNKYPDQVPCIIYEYLTYIHYAGVKNMKKY